MTLLRDREQMASVLFYVILALLAYLVFRVFRPFLVPLGWAGVLVVVFYPWHERLERRWGATRAAAFSTVVVTLILIVPALLVMSAFVSEGIDATHNVQQAFVEGRLPWAEHAWDWIRQRTPGAAEGTPDVASLAREAAQKVASYLAAKLGAILRNVVVFLFDLFVVIFALFYFFRDASAIVRGMRGVLPFEEEHREHLIQQARDLIFASVTAALIVAAVQGSLGGVMFAVLGLGAPFFWGVVMAFFSLLPVVGAWVVWAPAAGWLILSGEVVRGLVLIGLGAGVIGLVDNFLRPALISNRARLNGLLIFVSLLGGISVFGMLGVVLGPIVVATAASMLEVYTRQPAPNEEGSAETLRRTRNAVLE